MPATTGARSRRQRRRAERCRCLLRPAQIIPKVVQTVDEWKAAMESRIWESFLETFLLLPRVKKNTEEDQFKATKGVSRSNQMADVRGGRKQSYPPSVLTPCSPPPSTASERLAVPCIHCTTIRLPVGSFGTLLVMGGGTLLALRLAGSAGGKGGSTVRRRSRGDGRSCGDGRAAASAWPK